jgi:hypothetical protein
MRPGHQESLTGARQASLQTAAIRDVGGKEDGNKTGRKLIS